MKAYKLLLAGAVVSASLMVGQMVLAQVPVFDNSQNFSEPVVSNEQASSSNYHQVSGAVAQSSTPQSNESVFLLSKINELQQEIQKLRGQLEVQAHDLKLLNQQQTAFYSDLDQRVAQLAPTIPAELSTSTVVAAPATTMTTVALNATKETEQEMYASAYAQIQNRDFTQASLQMNEFLAQYPQSDYADNAHYWLGELYFAENELDKSIVEFNTVLQNYPQSTKMAATLLKLGFAYHKQGKLDLARLELEKLQIQYPNTSAAQLASARLKEMSEVPRTA